MKRFRHSFSSRIHQSRIFLIVAALCAGVSGCIPQDSPAPKRLNSVHRFELKGCEIRYNDQPLRLGATIDQWVQVLGPYDRMAPLANDLYVWDDIGIVLYITPKQTAVNSLAFIFNLEPDDLPPEKAIELFDRSLTSGEIKKGSSDYELVESMKETQVLILQSRPKTFFQDGFLMDGVILDQNVDIGAINDARYEAGVASPYFERRYLPSIYNLEYECPGGEMRVTQQINTLSTDRSRMRKYEVDVEFLEPSAKRESRTGKNIQQGL